MQPDSPSSLLRHQPYLWGHSTVYWGCVRVGRDVHTVVCAAATISLSCFAFRALVRRVDDAGVSLLFSRTALLVGCFAGYGVTLALLALSAFMEPGIVPCRPLTAEKMACEDDAPYCITCNIVRPPHTSHCSLCGVCVEGFDHHCHLLGACIGKRNVRFFASFLWVTSLLSILVAANTCFLLYVAWEEAKGERGINVLGPLYTLVAVVLAVFSVVVAVSLWSFGMYYCALQGAGVTSKSVLKGSKIGWSDVSCGVWCTSMFGALPPSRII